MNDEFVSHNNSSRGLGYGWDMLNKVGQRSYGVDTSLKICVFVLCHCILGSIVFLLSCSMGHSLDVNL